MTDAHIDKRQFALSAIESIATLQYYCLAAIVILYYDFFLTFNQEIERIWKQKISIISCIFVLNRYLTCLGYIPVLYFLFNSPTEDHACTTFARFPGSLSTITQFFVVVLLIIRVYAFYQRAVWILWVTVPLGVIVIAISAWGLAQVRTINLSFGPQTLFRACVPAQLQTEAIFKASWFTSGTFDTVIFGLTVYKTWTLCREHRQIGLQSKLSKLLMRDGAMYYGILAITNLINVIFFLMDHNTFFEQSAGNNSVLTHTLTSTLLSRLVLNLREAGAKPETEGTRFSTRLSIVPPEDIMLVPASTFSNSTATRSSDYTWSTSGGSISTNTKVEGSISKPKPLNSTLAATSPV